MDKENLIKKCLLLTCFLENIDASCKEKLRELVDYLESRTVEELEKYCNINSCIANIRLERMIKGE